MRPPPAETGWCSSQIYGSVSCKAEEEGSIMQPTIRAQFAWLTQTPLTVEKVTLEINSELCRKRIWF
jgi:hypothetical protein